LGLIERGAERTALIKMRQESREFAHSYQGAAVNRSEKSAPKIRLRKDTLPCELLKKRQAGFAQFAPQWQRFACGRHGDRVAAEGAVSCIRTTGLRIIRPAGGQALKLLLKFWPKSPSSKRQHPVPAHPVSRQRPGEPIKKNPNAGIRIEPRIATRITS
jgi:hypothetical protein